MESERLYADSNRWQVVQRELDWHEHDVHRRRYVDKLLYAPPVFDRIVQKGLSFLNAKPGQMVVDLACGEGKETLVFAKKGLQVISLDLSHSQLTRTRELVREFDPALQTHFVQANVEQLPFAGSTIDFIYGKAMLHHVDIKITQHEVSRVLKLGGRATFAEPMAHHPIFRVARRLTPRLRTQDEHPLVFEEVQQFAKSFPFGEVEESFLFAPVACLLRLLPGSEQIFTRLHDFLQRVDDWLFTHLPPLRKIAWYVLVNVQRMDYSNPLNSSQRKEML